MGLITEGKDFVTLTDICGLEDHLGDMDFKVAGTKDGITALQMDVKVTGIKAEVLTQAVEQAKRARMKILDLMVESISAPREKLSQYAPKIVSTKVPVAKIGDVIGSGGKIIHQIQDDFTVEVNIEDDGTVTVTGTDQSKVDAARAFIDSIVAEAEVGMTYQGTVARVEAFGAFVNILPGKDGLVHISQVQPEVFKTMKVGDKVEVRCYEVDSMGRVNLTMLKEGEAPIRAERPMGGDRPRFGGDRGGQRGGGRPNFRNFRDSR
jgi:polyribonucleotide nucleotidyltransferase